MSHWVLDQDYRVNSAGEFFRDKLYRDIYFDMIDDIADDIMDYWDIIEGFGVQFEKENGYYAIEFLEGLMDYIRNNEFHLIDLNEFYVPNWFDKDEIEFFIGKELTHEQFIDIMDFFDIETGLCNKISEVVGEYFIDYKDELEVLLGGE